ncbi:MAG TPA: hypothetical protein VHB45_08225 [Alloacidobacterium sp.]|nr:hypothetical protein [Alloacidobacterium sp.]
MISIPVIVLLTWIPISLFVFYRYPFRKALLIVMIGGWGILPNANYKLSSDPFPYWFMGLDIASGYLLTKATVVSFCSLSGLLLFDRNTIRRFSVTLWDIPMIVWCLVPIFSGTANSLSFAEIFHGEIYQLLAWGLPYLLGRIYFSTSDSLRLAAQAIVIAGLLYVPFCLFEIWRGPILYQHCYGYLPLQWVGAKRYIGYRPIGFLENGNQLGIWMATAALIAIWLWAKQIVKKVLGIPAAWAALLLFVVTLLCQSGGSILLLLGLLPFAFLSYKSYPRFLAVFLIAGIVGFAGLRLANVFSLRALVHHNAAAHATASFLKRIGRGSLGWRLSQDEANVGVALRKPLLGYGEWDWWRLGHPRPWGLWLLAFGMYGAFGFIALEMLQLAPVIRVVWFSLARSDIEYLNLRHALAGAILMTAIDNLLNGSMILPLLLVIGGMSTWSSAGKRVRVDIGC